jgi:predicted NBD/HSP70 family sugar kinase
MLTEATGLSTIIENDANALSMYELTHGVGREIDDFVLMLLREGVGGSVVKGGQIFPV